MKTPERSNNNPIDVHGDGRAIKIYQRLTDATHPSMTATLPKSLSCADDVAITGQWGLLIDEPASEMVDTAALDLKRFLKDAFRCELANPPLSGKSIRVSIDPTRGRVSDHSKRDHVIEIRRGSIEIIGVSEWGAACGLYHLQRLLRLRQAPLVSQGIIRGYPALEPSLTCLAFKRGSTEELDYPVAYHENYLLRIARSGYTGFHIDPGFNLFYKSDILPQLNHPQATKNLATLNKIAACARKCALEVFLTPYSPFFSKDHPVFKMHPEVRGSVLSAHPDIHILCTGQDKVRRFYEEQTAQLFRSAPGLAGVFLITGGEGFLHCYTAPQFRPENRTDCPCCRHKDPERSVTELVNGVAAAVKKAAPEALVVAWPYNAFTWAKNTAAVAHVSTLSPDCAYMGNFDTGDVLEREGVRSVSNDYSLSLIGPTSVFSRESKAAQRRGLKTMAKVESGCPREIHGVPTIPAMTRWGKKYDRILESGATGAMFAWQFSGFTESLSEELAGWMSWEPSVPTPRLLSLMAARDFGDKNATGVVQAWRWFDRAMDYFPFSSSTTSFRVGPFSIGFAQPLILDPMQPGELISSFWMGDFNSRGRPLFITDLSWTHPFGAEACLRALQKTERTWARGCVLLESLPAPGKSNSQTARLDAHQALARAILCMIRTAINTVLFLDLRDMCFREASSLRLVRRRLTKMRDIAKRELANAEEGTRCMRRNEQIGFDYINTQLGFTEAMAQSKIAHTRHLIDWVLPYRMFLHSYGMSARDEWIRDDGKKYR